MTQNNTHKPKELFAIAHSWLASVGIKVNSNYAKDAITTHPDYPALTALTDFFRKWWHGL